MDDQTLKVHLAQNGTIFAPYRISDFSRQGPNLYLTLAIEHFKYWRTFQTIGHRLRFFE